MSRFRRCVRVVSMLAVIFTIAAAVAADGPVIKQHRGAEPELSARGEAVQGDVIYTEFDYATYQTARLLEPAMIGNRIIFDTDKVLARSDSRKNERFCAWTSSAWSGEELKCLIPGPDNKFISRWVRSKGALVGRKRQLKKPAEFERIDSPLTSEQAREKGLRLFRAEILYQGAAGGVLRLLYREFNNDLARPAFSQELTYDIGNEPLTVSVKGARIEILEAGNSGIQYRVAKGFE